MDINSCSFQAIVGGQCGYDSKDRSRSVGILPLLNCKRDIAFHKSYYSINDVETEVELILARSSLFEQPRNVEKLLICPFHRASLGVSWNRRSSKCCIPVSLSHHSANVNKKPKADRGLNKGGSQTVFKETGIFLAVGSGEFIFSWL